MFNAMNLHEYAIESSIDIKGKRITCPLTRELNKPMNT